jgi:hypothetical protein
MRVDRREENEPPRHEGTKKRMQEERIIGWHSSSSILNFAFILLH